MRARVRERRERGAVSRISVSGAQPSGLRVGEQRQAGSGPHADLDSELQGFESRRDHFEELGAFTELPFTIDGPDGSERAIGYQTTAGLLDQTHVAPLLGRLFTAEETPGGPNVVVLSHGLWQRRFGADRAVVGQADPIDWRSPHRHRRHAARVFCCHRFSAPG